MGIFVACAALARPLPSDPGLVRAVIQLSGRLSDGIAKLDQASIDAYALPRQTAVLFAVEGPGGGNGSLQFIAFFTPVAGDGKQQHSTRTRYRLLAYGQVGARGARLFRPGSGVIRNRQVELEGAAYRTGDAMCCPSRKLRSAFALQDNRVVESPLGPATRSSQDGIASPARRTF